MSSYQNLIVWQKAIDLCIKVYKTTENFPKYEVYGITSQIRRAAVSIASNIAEGQRRGHKQEFIQFLRISYGSGAELETQLIISLKVGYITQIEFDKINNLLEEVMKMLNKMIY
jgi:four helix bundle protein